MTAHDPHDLEREIGRALAALPQPSAPRTLLPRVLHEVHGLAAPARRDSARWVGWSPQARALLVGVSLAVLTAAYWLWPVLALLGSALLPEPLQAAGRRADLVAASATDLWRVGTLVWAAVVAPIAKGLLALTLGLCAACALFAAALGRLALGGAHQS